MLIMLSRCYLVTVTGHLNIHDCFDFISMLSFSLLPFYKDCISLFILVMKMFPLMSFVPLYCKYNNPADTLQVFVLGLHLCYVDMFYLCWKQLVHGSKGICYFSLL